MLDIMREIPIVHQCKRINLVEEGWSSDKKFYLIDENGVEYMLRLSSGEQYEAKLEEFKRIKQFNHLSFPMSQAIEFGTCDNGAWVYLLLTWVNGQSLEKCITALSDEVQYELGCEAGKILKEIHHLPVKKEIDVFGKIETMCNKMKRYETCHFRMQEDEFALDFFYQNIQKIKEMKVVYNHGDFHLGNLVLTPEGKIGVIDFNRSGVSDYVEEFYKVQSFDIEKSVMFARGQIDGYFSGEPPHAFFDVLAVYCAYSSLYSIAWAIKFGEDEIKGMQRRCAQTFEDYNHFKQSIPAWYKGDGRYKNGDEKKTS